MAGPKKYVLTEQEREFAEKNHNIIYDFLHKRRLGTAEFYEAAVFGFLRAVKDYHRKPGLAERFAFSTIAWKRMRTYVGNETKAERSRKSHIACSIEELTESGTEYSEFLSDGRYGFLPGLEQELETQGILEELLPVLPGRQQGQVVMRFLGYKRKDIVRHQGISISTYKKDRAAIKNVAAAVLEQRLQAICGCGRG